jgi:hypothetical protein
MVYLEDLDRFELVWCGNLQAVVTQERIYAVHGSLPEVPWILGDSLL